MKNIINKIQIALLVSFLGASTLLAQHEVGPSLASQSFSRINFNPAGVGNNKDINIFSQTRLQWVGFDGAPISTILNGHYFNERLKSGFGLSLTYDQIGNNKTALNAKAVYAYNLDLWENGLLSLGAAAGINQFSKSFANDIFVPDQSFGFGDNSQVNPDFDFGFEFSMPWLLVGASITHIAQMDKIYTLSPTQTYHAYVRGSINANQDFLIAPSVFFMNSGQTNVCDINATVFYQQRFWGGLNFRVGTALAFLVGMEWEWLRVGYNYELSLSETAEISHNTHEIVLGFKIPMSRY